MNTLLPGPEDLEAEFPAVDLSDRCCRAAAAIVKVVVDNAARARDGQVYWVHPPNGAGRISPRPLGPFLYAGTAGIALLLAEASRRFLRPDLGVLAVEALCPTRRELRDLAHRTAAGENIRLPIGGLAGIGSLIYGFVLIGELLLDETLLDDAHLAATFLEPRALEGEQALDLMTGVAGALSGLLVLAAHRAGETLNGQSPRDLAEVCAERLWRHRPYLSPGFCHGYHGILSALVRAAASGIGAGIQFTELLDLSQARLSEPFSTHHASGWCKGLPGQLLLGLALDRHFELPATRHRISDLAESIIKLPLSDRDDLCCGNSGHIDVLRYAAGQLSEPSYLYAAQRISVSMLDRALLDNFYVLRVQGNKSPDLRLFPGLAGIGHALLNLGTGGRQISSQLLSVGSF